MAHGAEETYHGTTGEDVSSAYEDQKTCIFVDCLPLEKPMNFMNSPNHEKYHTFIAQVIPVISTELTP